MRKFNLRCVKTSRLCIPHSSFIEAYLAARLRLLADFQGLSRVFGNVIPEGRGGDILTRAGRCAFRVEIGGSVLSVFQLCHRSGLAQSAVRLYHLIVHGEHARVVGVGWRLIHVHRGEPSVLGLTLVHILSDLRNSGPLESRQQERV